MSFVEMRRKPAPCGALIQQYVFSRPFHVGLAYRRFRGAFSREHWGRGGNFRVRGGGTANPVRHTAEDRGGKGNEGHNRCGGEGMEEKVSSSPHSRLGGKVKRGREGGEEET